jgi:hypothetical protein
MGINMKYKERGATDPLIILKEDDFFKFSVGVKKPESIQNLIALLEKV